MPCYRCAYCLEADSRTSTLSRPPFVSYLGVHYLSKTFGLKRVCSVSFFLANCISRSFTNYNCYTSLPLIEIIMPVLRATTRRTVQLVTTPPDVRPRQQDKLDNTSIYNKFGMKIFYFFRTCLANWHGASIIAAPLKFELFHRSATQRHDVRSTYVCTESTD